MVKTPIVKEALPYVIVLTAIIAAIYIWFPAYNLISLFPLILIGFILFFFRNPYRNIPTNENIILSPADGKVMDICEVYEDTFLHQEAIKITIFLSPFNVHINRSPIAGDIRYQQYTCGRFHPAYKQQVGCENERHALGIEGTCCRLMVIQIAGVLARRIVSWVTIGDILAIGQRYGMIKFSSCTELIIPKNVQLSIKTGDHVRGGETIIAHLNNN